MAAVSSQIESSSPGVGSRGARHLLLIALVAVVYEAQFLYVAPNPIDEGWPLYAAKRLHEGGTLYADTFFVFPPGHLLSAWIGYGVAPPGLEATRVLYAAFNVALCLALFAFARRLLPPHLAVLAALLVALASYRVHSHHAIFGFRYLVWSFLALLAFARCSETDDRRWMFAAGVAAGLATAFRLTPGFSVSVAIGVATLTLPGGLARWLADWRAFGIGLLGVLVPLIAWSAAGVDLATLWREVVVRPVVMTDLQSLPLPPLFPETLSGRDAITASFVALQFRVYPVLLAAYGVALAAVFVRSKRAGQGFPAPVLLCSWVFALVYFTRSLGRSDEGHLVSALPPLCLLLVHALAAVAPALRTPRHGVWVGASVLVLWIGLWGADRAFAPLLHDLAASELADRSSWLDGRSEFRASQGAARARIERGDPERVLLDLAARPLVYTSGEFTGPGWADVVMPGTFMSDEEELAFLRRLRMAPPAGVFWPSEPFDAIAERGPRMTAPQVSRWAVETYGPPPAQP